MDGGSDAGTGMDGGIGDSGLPTCGEAFIAFRFHFEGEIVHEDCLPLRDGVVQTNGMDCTYHDVLAGAYATETTDGFAGIEAVLGGRPFDATGAVADWTTIRLAGSASPFCPPDDLDGFCNYDANAPPGCRFEVTRAGTLGNLVEARLTEPCRLPFSDVIGPSTRRPIVDALQFRGPLSLVLEADASMPECDAGSDGGM
jgi:hypothetical protein